MNFLKRTQIVIFICLILGFLLPQWGVPLKPYIIWALLLMNTLALVKMDMPKFKGNVKNISKQLIIAFTLTPIILIILAQFIQNPAYKGAFYIMAAMPPAVAILPLLYLLKGDLDTGMSVQFLSYLFTFIFTPAIIYIFLREVVSVYEIFKILFLLIIVPFILSRIIRRFNIKHDFKIEINLIIGYTFYVAVAISQAEVISQWKSLIFLTFIVILYKFVPMFIAYFMFRKESLSKRINYVIFSMQKNNGLALGFVILFLPPVAAIVMAVDAMIAAFRTWVLFMLFEKRI